MRGEAERAKKGAAREEQSSGGDETETRMPAKDRLRFARGLCSALESLERGL